MTDRALVGRTAVLRWAYYTAAKIEGYSVTRSNAKSWSGSGTFLPGSVDAFKLAQRPLILVAFFRGGSWEWEVQRLTKLDGGRFVATLGPMTVNKSNGNAHTQTRDRNDRDFRGRFDRR